MTLQYSNDDDETVATVNMCDRSWFDDDELDDNYDYEGTFREYEDSFCVYVVAEIDCYACICIVPPMDAVDKMCLPCGSCFHDSIRLKVLPQEKLSKRFDREPASKQKLPVRYGQKPGEEEIQGGIWLVYSVPIEEIKSWKQRCPDEFDLQDDYILKENPDLPYCALKIHAECQILSEIKYRLWKEMSIAN